VPKRSSPVAAEIAAFHDDPKFQGAKGRVGHGPDPVATNCNRLEGTSGTTAIEYATIASVIALALLVCLPGFSAAVGALFASVVGAI